MFRGWMCLCLMVFTISCCRAQDDNVSPQLKTASGHPMQYYLSLPHGWMSGKRWPVVVVIESANRQFQETAELFVRARREMPFILVAPLVVTNGGPGYRSVPSYHYTDTTWDQIERQGPYRFDMDGIAAVIADVKKLYSGEDKVYLTGWEAGGHTIWAMIFQHPEAPLAAAPVCPNYAGRGMDAHNFSTAAARVDLPVKIFHGAADPAWSPHRPLYVQAEAAKEAASAHGYRNITQVAVSGKGHEPLAPEVLAYFSSLLKH